MGLSNTSRVFKDLIGISRDLRVQTDSLTFFTILCLNPDCKLYVCEFPSKLVQPLEREEITNTHT